MMHYGPHTVSRDLEQTFKRQAETIRTAPKEYKAALDTRELLRSIDPLSITDAEVKKLLKCLNNLVENFSEFRSRYTKGTPYYQEIGYVMAEVLSIWQAFLKIDQSRRVEDKLPVILYSLEIHFRVMFCSEVSEKRRDDVAKELINNMIESGVWNVDPVIVENEM